MQRAYRRREWAENIAVLPGSGADAGSCGFAIVRKGRHLMRHCPQAELHDLRAQIRQKELRTAEVQKRLTELEAAGAAEYLRSILVLACQQLSAGITTGEGGAEQIRTELTEARDGIETAQVCHCVRALPALNAGRDDHAG